MTSEPEDKDVDACVACGSKGRYTIQLSIGPDGGSDDARFYIPNDFVRSIQSENLSEVPFCATCMRAVEDNLRATIRYLQHENDKTPPSIYEFGFERSKSQ